VGCLNYVAFIRRPGRRRRRSVSRTWTLCVSECSSSTATVAAESCCSSKISSPHGKGMVALPRAEARHEGDDDDDCKTRTKARNFSPVRRCSIGGRHEYQHLPTIVANEPDRLDRGTGSGNEDRHVSEQGSIRGTHLRYAKLDRGSRSTLVWIDDPGSIECT
jgi:hypothetical protein